MSVLTILETLLIGPLKLVFEIIFTVAHRFIGHPGLAIIVLSLVMNTLVLPLYKRADAMQEEARDKEDKLKDGVNHIKKTFSGDERMMILQTYYRQNNYKPTQALNSSVSLLLQIPFFIAAYQFLSNLEVLDNVSLGPITNMGAPDGLIVLGGLTINFLPILMTLVNIISSAIYLKGFPLKTKIQLYAMALFFLVFLYNSPACLVFYWTLNNVFSFVKNIFYKIKNPGRVLSIMLSLAGIGVAFFAVFIYSKASLIRNIFLVCVGMALQFPLIWSLVKKHIRIKEREYTPNKKVFILGAVFAAFLTGLLIPSTFIAASPQEYVDMSYFFNPAWYVVSSLCLAAGTFVVWVGVFYRLASSKGKVVFEKLIWVLCGVMTVNYMFFGTKLGTLYPTLVYETGLVFTKTEQLLNIAVVFVVAVVLYLVSSKWKQATAMVLLTAIIAVGGMSVFNMVQINSSVNAIAVSENADEIPSFQLSKEGKNVIVVMLDRAMGEYVPYAFNEKPELKEKFDGFTYYSNVISFGGHTNFGVPSLVGGYEYTPVEMNKRSEELLADKHNEALKLMPAVFSENGYDVTVCDPPYAGYKQIPDLSIYDDLSNVKAYTSGGKFDDNRNEKYEVESNLRNFFCFAVMKSMPLSVQPLIYNDGSYNKADYVHEDIFYKQSVNDDLYRATGMYIGFTEPYNVMKTLPSITECTDNDQNTFMFIANKMTHDAMYLQMPEYVPALEVDNTEYELAHPDRFTIDGKTLAMDTAVKKMHYQANMAAYIVLGEWFDYLRENDVYDNSRIIVVSDHGYDLNHMPEFTIEGENLETYYPLLMVKDFESTGFDISDEFMTNADVPSLAVEGIIENPVNPFTGKVINNAEKYSHEQFVALSHIHFINKNNGNTYLPSKWASVKDDMREMDNWTFYPEEFILDEYTVK